MDKRIDIFPSFAWRRAYDKDTNDWYKNFYNKEYKTEHTIVVNNQDGHLKTLLLMASNDDRDGFIKELLIMCIEKFKTKCSIQFIFPPNVTHVDRYKIHKMQSLNGTQYFQTFTQNSRSKLDPPILNLFIKF